MPDLVGGDPPQEGAGWHRRLSCKTGGRTHVDGCHHPGPQHRVDVREPDEVAQARLAEAVNVPMSSFDLDLIPVDTGKKVVFVCARGLRSEQVRQYVLSQGILSDAYNVAGGVMAWSQAGLPLETGPLSSPA